MVVCVYACVFPLVLTRFTVKSYSPRRTIGTAQKIGQQGGSLAIRMDCLVAYPKIQAMLLDASRSSLMGRKPRTQDRCTATWKTLNKPLPILSRSLLVVLSARLTQALVIVFLHTGARIILTLAHGVELLWAHLESCRENHPTTWSA